MSLHQEVHFETEIAEHLAAHGWLYATDDGVHSLYCGDKCGLQYHKPYHTVNL